MKPGRLFLYAFLLSLASSALAAPSPVTWKARLEPADARAGESAQVVVEAQIQEEWHLYSLTKRTGLGPRPTTVKLVEPEGSAAQPLTAEGEAVQPVPKREIDPGFKVEVEFFERAVSLGLPVKLAAGIRGEQKATAAVRFMVCKHGTCIPPDTVELPFTFTVAEGPARPERQAALTTAPSQPAGFESGTGAAPSHAPGAPTATTGVDTSGGSAGQIRDAKSKGLLYFLGFAVMMGFLALMTPCVFPMVPITVSFFSKQQEMNPGSGIRAAVAYCVGIIGTFTGLGIVMALVFGASSIGTFASNPYVNIVLAVLFVVMALNLFGAFEINLPSWLVEKSQSGTQKGGIIGPLLMGLTFTLTSFTCTFGFVGGLLAATTQGDVLWPILGMLGFSTAFASPFFLLALFPQWLGKLPRSGSWLVTVKGFMGFLELAAALKFLSNIDLQWKLGILTQPVFLAVWAALFLVAASYLMGWLRLPHDSDTRIGPLRIGFAIATGVLGIWCLGALNGASLGKLTAFLPPRNYPYRSGAGGGAAAHTAGGVKWLRDYQEALALAKSENRPLFVDFTGITCTNCREMEETVFTRPEVAAQLSNFVTVSLYTDLEDDPASARYKKMQEERYGTVELPLYVVMAPNEEKLAQISYEPNHRKFLDFLMKARQTFAERQGTVPVARGN